MTMTSKESEFMAGGCLSLPRMPDFPGRDSFKGRLYHTGMWPHDGADDVRITGDFVGWGSGVPMHRRASDGRFAVSLRLLKGTTQHFKFIVDGQWSYNPHLPFREDQYGNINNYIDVLTDGMRAGDVLRSSGSAGGLPAAPAAHGAGPDGFRAGPPAGGQAADEAVANGELAPRHQGGRDRGTDAPALDLARRVERAGLRGLKDGQKIGYELESDRRTGRQSAVNLQVQ